MYDAGNPKPVLCDNLEGWDGERGVQEGGDMYIPNALHADVWQKLLQYRNYLLILKKEKEKGCNFLHGIY